MFEIRQEREMAIDWAVQLALSVLDEHERMVISNRFLAQPPKTLDAVAKLRGVTRERVRQIQIKAIRKIRWKFKFTPDLSDEAVDGMEIFVEREPAPIVRGMLLPSGLVWKSFKGRKALPQSTGRHKSKNRARVIDSVESVGLIEPRRTVPVPLPESDFVVRLEERPWWVIIPKTVACEMENRIRAMGWVRYDVGKWRNPASPDEVVHFFLHEEKPGFFHAIAKNCLLP